jgi:hypothetical protein
MNIQIVHKTSDHPFPVLILEGVTLKDGYELGMLKSQLIQDGLTFWTSVDKSSILLRIPLVPSTNIGLINLVELTNKLKDGYINDPS